MDADDRDDLAPSEHLDYWTAAIVLLIGPLHRHRPPLDLLIGVPMAADTPAPTAPAATHWLVPKRLVSGLLTHLLAAVLGGLVAIEGGHLHPPFGPTPGPAPSPVVPAPTIDPHFVAAGKAYLPQLGAAYADAWDAGANDHESGHPLSASMGRIGKSWDGNRAKLFDRALTPELSRIVPESQKDADETPAQRAAMVAAMRGIAKGLRGGK